MHNPLCLFICRSENTWEPTTNILDKSIITKFNNQKETKVKEVKKTAGQAPKRKADSKVFVVEEIVASRQKKGKLEFCVKWKNYPE